MDWVWNHVQHTPAAKSSRCATSTLLDSRIIMQPVGAVSCQIHALPLLHKLNHSWYWREDGGKGYRGLKFGQINHMSHRHLPRPHALVYGKLPFECSFTSYSRPAHHGRDSVLSAGLDCHLLADGKLDSMGRLQFSLTSSMWLYRAPESHNSYL